MANNWQLDLQEGFHTPEALLAFLELDGVFFSLKAHQQFKTKVPRSFAERMQKGNKNCPLLRQVLPLLDEEIDIADFVLDPLAEKEFNSTPGILHKYHGRALVMLATSCAVNCRYCFRRHFPYAENRLSTKAWEGVFNYLKEDKSISEVILSGGDSLMLSNDHLKKFITQLEGIEHINTLRIHTRLPVVTPSRMDKELIELLAETRFNTVVVYHINHQQELCDEIKQHVSQMRQHHITVLNQSVLLKGVNDSNEALISLSQALWSYGILPYYLHLLDKTQNTAHFDISEQQALQLFRDMKTNLPGYLVPRLVREQSGSLSKTWF